MENPVPESLLARVLKHPSLADYWARAMKEFGTTEENGVIILGPCNGKWNGSTGFRFDHKGNLIIFGIVNK